MTTGRQLVDLARTQEGKPYVFGAEARTMNAPAWDCSEITSVTCQVLGVTLPDGAYYQWKYCTPTTLAVASSTPGALLFYGTGRGVGRAAITHVAFSKGDGNTGGEARNSRMGVGSWPIGSRFTFAGLIPGVDYSTSPSTPTNPLEHIGAGIREDNDMGAFLRSDPAKGGDGSIYHVYGERIRHLTPEQWAKRQFLGAKVQNQAPMEILHLAADLISDPT